MKVFRKRNWLYGVGFTLIVVGMVVWILRPVPACTIADRAADAYKEGNYKKLWKNMGPFARAEFNNDRSVFLLFADEFMEPRRHHLQRGEFEPAVRREHLSGCIAQMQGDGFSLGVMAEWTGKRNELISTGHGMAMFLYFADFDLVEMKKEDPLAPLQATLDFANLVSDFYREHDLRVRRESVLRGDYSLVTIDEHIQNTSERIANAERRLAELERSPR